MECENLVFSGHAIQRMFYRRISQADVQAVITYGEMIEDYPDDEPFPCCLLFDYVDGNPLHVLVSQN